MRDLHSRIRVVRVISPIAVGTTGVGKTGKIIDRQGYESAAFAIGYGAITATGAVFTVTCKHGDATGAMTSAADADLVGTEAAAGIAAGARVSGSTMNVTKKLGYIGNKRYVTLDVKSTATAGTPVHVDAILGNPALAPVS